MSNWQAGDLAVCVDLDDLCDEDTMHLTIRKGAVYTVTDVFESVGHLNIRELGLSFAEVKPPPRVRGYVAYRFRKIDKHEACEEEFVTLLKRSKRRVEA